MAQLDTGGGDKGKGGKVRSKKQSTSVDLTAMVDLAFLLITFFMLTTSLSKPQSMDLAMPAKEKDKTKIEEMNVADNRTLTILLGADNQVKWYMGQFATPLAGPTDTSYGKDGIRKELLARVTSVVAETRNPEKGLIVIIKPSKESNYRNLVDILDEMAITKVPSYAIVDISPEELQLLEGSTGAN
ncbi:ExbD/TolR family protein [Flavobacterium sp. '19STA2R22 D10 B1']|uniref:ExbD/TolR family protein n=1 Tax=Flavobacterium aerium TaxID=3037261 RepID=UPI00278BC9D3|nr:biopolymer transporter ExbD [Flavobacterium sp. '19STA2R22 D10 B1']